MDDRIRQMHQAAKSVRDFTNQHPSDIEGHAATAAELSQAVDRMDNAMAMFETGTREAAAAKKETNRLLGVIHNDFMLPIAAIARGNGAFDPGLARKFRAPSPRRDRVAFIGAAQSVKELAEGAKTIFIIDGMPATFVEDFGGTLSAYNVAATAFNNNYQLHVQALAELKLLTGQVMRLMKRLDGINRARFRKDQHLFSAWQAARNVSWPAGTAAKAAAKKEASA
ncbi:MAG: hypothetical protein ABI742_14415 [Gemmatimonadota bacterium]